MGNKPQSQANLATRYKSATELQSDILKLKTILRYIRIYSSIS
jgi:hypothetical protein